MTTSAHSILIRSLAILLALGIMAAFAAQAQAAGKGKPKPDRSRIDFAGHGWDVKSSGSRVGPGPNVFSARNVRVDRNGDLRLRVQKRRGQWTSAEVILDRPLGHGTYAFEVSTPLGDLDPNVVFAMFTWSDDPAQNNREIDIEFSRFGDPLSPVNAHYTVQPYTTPGNGDSWTMPNLPDSRHTFSWLPDRVRFGSTSGLHDLRSWSYTNPTGVPDEGDAQLRFNLWLFGGNAPLDGRATEIVISDFTFIPA